MRLCRQFHAKGLDDRAAPQAAASPLLDERGEPMGFTDAEEAILASEAAGGVDLAALRAMRLQTRASLDRLCRLEQVLGRMPAFLAWRCCALVCPLAKPYRYFAEY